MNTYILLMPKQTLTLLLMFFTIEFQCYHLYTTNKTKKKIIAISVHLFNLIYNNFFIKLEKYYNF